MLYNAYKRYEARRKRIDHSHIGRRRATIIGIVKDANPKDKTITVTISYGGNTFDKTFSLEPDVEMYDKGAATDFTNLNQGEEVALMYDLTTPATEGVDPFNQAIGLKGIFVTQYNLRDVITKEEPLYGQPNNIMPLSQYDQLQHKK